MNDNRQTELESRIHDLLTGNLDDTQRCDLLRQIARDDNARRLLGEMADLQWQARSCLGLQLDRPRVQSALAKTLDALRASGMPVSTAAVSDHARPAGPARRSWRPALVRIAAGLLLVASVAVGYLIGAGRSIEQRPSPLVSNPATNQVALPEIKPEDSDRLRQTWAQLDQAGGKARPWILMSDSTGEFGYLPISGQEPAGQGKQEGFMLVRCTIVAPGQPPTQLNLLLPRGQSGELSVPGAAGGQIASQPLDLAVSTSAGRVHIGVRAGRTASEQFGLEGTVVPGQTAVDAGQFRLGGRMFTVFMEAVSLAG